jgi:S1-C subfamily serine protease
VTGSVIAPAAIYKRLLPSTALFVVDRHDPAGKRVTALGTGWLVDRNRKLLVTNHHVVGDGLSVKVYFPIIEQGQLVSERNRYLVDAKPILGEVFLDEPLHDLALVRLDRLPEICPAVPIANASPAPGDSLYSIGNPGASGALFVFSEGVVRQVYHEQIRYSNGQEVSMQIVESQSPINPGDSGGPVVDDEANLVGVVASHRTGVQLVSQFIDVSEVKKLMRDADELWAPQSASQFERRGLQYFARGDMERALADANAAIKLDSRKAELHLLRAQADFGLRRPAAIVENDVRQAKELDPQYASAAIRRYAGKHLIFRNGTNESLDVSVHFRAAGSDGKVYWYPTPPGQGSGTALHVEPRQSSQLLYDGQPVAVVEFVFSAQAPASGHKWSVPITAPRRLCPDDGYISWRTGNWFEQLRP